MNFFFYFLTLVIFMNADISAFPDLDYAPCKTENELKPHPARRKDGSLLWVFGGGSLCNEAEFSNEMLISKRISDSISLTKLRKLEKPLMVIPNFVGVKVYTINSIYQIEAQSKLKCQLIGLQHLMPHRNEKLNMFIAKQSPEAGSISKSSGTVNLWLKKH